jgi:hypothetical protein
VKSLRTTHPASPFSVIVNVHSASVRSPSGVGLSWKLMLSLQGHTAVETCWYFQLAEHCTCEDGSTSVKSRVVLNLDESGHVLPGRPVSRPIKWTFMVGMDQDSVVRVARRGTDKTGRARESERKVDWSIMMIYYCRWLCRNCEMMWMLRMNTRKQGICSGLISWSQSIVWSWVYPLSVRAYFQQSAAGTLKSWRSRYIQLQTMVTILARIPPLHYRKDKKQ